MVEDLTIIESIHEPNMALNTIYCENCLDTMAKMPDEFVNLTVTSPPYGNIRDYNGYEFDFSSIARELYRVTIEGGVVVWVVGDTVESGSETGEPFKQALFFKEVGFRLHDTMIYMSKQKYPDQKRYGNCFEYMFILSKGSPQTVNLIKDRKNRWFESFGVQSERKKDGSLVKREKIKMDEYGTRFNIWKIDNGFGNSTDDVIAFKHPATFPEEIPRDHIYTWSKEGDLIYDPFMGSGTTAKMAHIQKRNWIGSEISQEYCNLANKRIRPYLSQTVLI